ncbi:MAG: flagellin [Christensenellaceae bacterium]
MRIANNIMAMNTHRQYTIQNDRVSASAEKLSSGYRINRAADDAAGLAISEKMRSQIRGLNRAVLNSQDAASLIQTAEGALQEVHSMLQRMNELAVQSATGTNQEFDRTQIAKEFDQLKREINDIAEQTTFNNMKILDGSLSNYGTQRAAATAGLFVTNGDEFGAAVEQVMHMSAVSGLDGAKDEFASFSLNLKGAAIEAIADQEAKLQITVGGATLTAADALEDQAAAYSTGDSLTADEIAAVFNGGTLEIKIDGIDYEFGVVSSGNVLTFTMSKADGTAITAGDFVDFNEESLKAAFENENNTLGDDKNGETYVENYDITKLFGWQAGTKDKDATPAMNTYTFDGVLKQGDQFTFNGKQFELIAAGGSASAGYIGVTMDSSGANENANTVEALVTALKTHANADGKYDIEAYVAGESNVLHIKQDDPDVPVDLTMSMKPAEAKNGMIEFDPVKLKVGDKISVKVTDDKGNISQATYLHQEGQGMAEIFATLGVGNAERSGNYIKYDGKYVEMQFEETMPVDSETMRIQVGALEGEQLNIEVRAMNTTGLGLDSHSIYTQDDAGKAITAVRNAVNIVSDQRALLGAMQNRMTYKINNLKISAENLQAAESRIRDVDIASEMTEFTKANILSQAATAMLAQANSAPQNVLSLLR